MSASDRGKENAGLALPSLIVGLLAGLAIYAIGEYWIEPSNETALSITAFLFVGAVAAAWLLLAERNDIIRPIFVALVIGAVLAGPNFYMASAVDPQDAQASNMNRFPLWFWYFLGQPLAAYLMITLSKAVLKTGAPPKYDAVFFHGLTLPLIAGGAKVFAGLAFVLLLAWAALLKSMDVDIFAKAFREALFIWPFIGAVSGLSVAMMRGQQAVLGALRYVLLLISRILMPIMAVFSLTFVLVLALNGPGAVFDYAYPGGIMIGLAFAGMLIFNGVYQNGEGGPPPAWLRLATIVALATFPVYAGIAAHAFWLRVGEYGLTPPRIYGLVMTFMTFAYSVVCLAGLLTEVNWRGKRWMPLVAPLNILMAVLWIVVLLALASPFVNSWAISAKSQERRLVEERVDAGEFDFGYLRFELGDAGERALDRLSNMTAHPQTSEIRAGVEKARNASSYWSYRNDEIEPVEAPTPEEAAPAPGEEGPMDLQLNPEGADPDGEGAAEEDIRSR